eukprot:TRINITY_DN12922_c0_g1_i1.p1 TRINITY_DN12922_c0_g1~~TRINITY_DN12922_c0_g1_i1.p1  ORF type:complete len:378 (-),score=111.26 TRINITY_DN12922_c0_g1_i1:355-1380(-)
MNMIAGPGQEQIWSSMPHAVPRHEWEVHLDDVHGHVEGLLRRVKHLEGESRYAGSDLSGLHRQCLDLQGTKRGHNELRLLFDVEVAERKAHVQEALHEAQAYATAQMESLRADLGQELSALRQGLQDVTDEARRLNQVFMEKTASFELTLATKEEQKEAVAQMKKQTEAAMEEQRRHLKSLEVTKASKDEMNNLRKLLEGQCEVIRQDLNQSVHTMTVASGDIVDLQRRCQEELVHVSVMTSASASLETLLRQADEAFKERQQMREEFGLVRSQVYKCVEEQVPAARREAAEVKKSNAELSTSLNNIRTELLSRCSRVEEDLKIVDRRERSSWEQFYRDRQ